MSGKQSDEVENPVVSNTDEFIIESAEDDPNYDKLGALIAEMEDDIRRANNNSIAVEKVIMSLRNDAHQSAQSPQAEHVALLYRHMAKEMASPKSTASSKPHSKPFSSPQLNYEEQDDDNDSDTVSLTGEIPFFLYSGSSRQIIGREAFSRNVFYSRSATALFAFIAFVVMSCVPNIGWRSVDPDRYLEATCPFKGYYEGSFSFVSFHYIIALCVIIFLHNTLWIAYYLLPVDTADRKYVPGLRSLFDPCLNPSDVTTYGQRLGEFFNLYSKSLEPILDGGFLSMIFVASILASIALERGEIFYNRHDPDDIDPYFSYATYMKTFDNEDGCLEGNPVSLVKAALAMSFLCMFCLAFTFQVTFRSFLLERKRRGGMGGGSKGGLASQELSNDSNDRAPGAYESSNTYRLPGGEKKKFVRV